MWEESVLYKRDITMTCQVLYPDLSVQGSIFN